MRAEFFGPPDDPEIASHGWPARVQVGDDWPARVQVGDDWPARVQVGDYGASQIRARDADSPQNQTAPRVEPRDARHVSHIRVIRRPWAAVVAVVGVVVISLGVAGLWWAGRTGRSATPVGHPPVTPIPAGHYAAAPEAKTQFVPRPTGLVIPAIGVRTTLVRLGLTATGTLQVPSSIGVAGWYTGSPRPGAIGSAVIAGHIDSVSGPGVFFRLREMRPGELIYVERPHGSMAVFKVTSVRRFLKAKFPTAAVYGPVPNAQLRLITCGGTFDPSTGHYMSNVAVFAVLQPPSS